jgi:hypothetical protein
MMAVTARAFTLGDAEAFSARVMPIAVLGRSRPRCAMKRRERQSSGRVPA